ncbi:hypothetical protein K438DRAFT_1706366 [Mycena galopus ATCC 62051]|nr:hypothetical protein K438DRAFT_1706366 [Mycena galopus ATCC 62051]
MSRAMSSTAAGIRAQMSDLASAISCQQQLLDEMLARLRDLQTELDSILYPVLTIPTEITSEIFIHCLPSDRDSNVVRVNTAPLLLTHVCREWRNIAISLPSLWTTIGVKHAYRLSHLTDIMRTWFERAQKCPLSVSIEGLLFSHKPFPGFLEVFRQHSPQMRSLELHTTSFADMDQYPLVLPLLQKLAIRLIDPNKQSIKMFNSVPLLDDVVMRGAVPSEITLPWQQVTKFTGERFYIEDCLETIRLLPNLVQCAFSMFDGEFDDEDGLDVVSHPNMQHLTVFCTSDASGSAKLLPFLTLPALQTLEILDMDNFDPEELDFFLTRSPGLRKLVVHDSESDEGTWLDLSDHFAALGLTDLEIWDPCIDFWAYFFEALEGGLLPQLQSLSLLECRGPGLDVHGSLPCAEGPITARWRIVEGCVQLQSFRIVSQNEINAQANLVPFKMLKESGMDVYIGTKTGSVI